MTLPAGLPPRERRLAFLTISIGICMAVLDGTIINVALPVVARDLQVSASAAVWVVNSYQLAVVASLLPLAAMGESVGYRRVYLVGLAVFTLASLACAFSPSLPVLIAMRVVQGFGAAGIMSVNIALVRFIFPPDQIGRGVGVTALVVAVSSAAGPSVAAVIMTAATWPWLFLVNVPLGVMALATGFWTLPATPRSHRPFDLTSTLLNAATFGLLIIGIDGLGTSRTGWVASACILGAAIVIGTVFVRLQMRIPTPLLPVDLLAIPTFRLSMITSVCAFSAQTLAYVALPFYFHDILGRSVVETGLLLTPWPLAVAMAAPISGPMADRRSPALLGGLGLGVMAAGLVLLSLLPPAPSVLDIVWRLVVCGLGFGAFQAPNNRMIITSAPPERSGGASGMQASARLVGQSLGAAFVAVIFGLLPQDRTIPAALWLAVLLAMAGCLASSLRRAGPATR